MRGSSESWLVGWLVGSFLSIIRSGICCCEDSTRPDVASHSIIRKVGCCCMIPYTMHDVANLLFVHSVCSVRSFRSFGRSFGTTLDLVHKAICVWPILRLSSNLESLSRTSPPPLPSLLSPPSPPRLLSFSPTDEIHQMKYGKNTTLFVGLSARCSRACSESAHARSRSFLPTKNVVH